MQEGTCNNYFTLPRLPWMMLVILGLYVFTCGAVFCPHLLPYSFLGPIGTLIKFVLDTSQYGCHVILLGATLTHLVEAAYSWHLCTSKGIIGSARIKWFVSTLIFGGASLYELAQFRG
ncbi:transmembrane protein 254-like isoform X2 [Asterias amurensis]|uniref:transmembrane protein 254-like isoform X2 n=1 Tax=Asterias amurensis TaxID=7602 RepID=UPI003AB8C6C6